MLETAPPYASPETQSTNRYRQVRREIRRAGSAFLDATSLLEGHDYRVSLRMYRLSEWLLRRLVAAERRGA